MHEAASKAEKDPDQLSLVHSVRYSRRSLAIFTTTVLRDPPGCMTQVRQMVTGSFCN